MGSLCWATPARTRIGIDTMADAYSKFPIREQDMVYIASTERRIPLPSSYVDVLFTLNALDHVSFLRPMCAELLRILTPGGSFFGSFNLGEPATFSEPMTLTEKKIERELLGHLEVTSYLRAAAAGPKDGTYSNFRVPTAPAPPPDTGILWVRARKPSDRSYPISQRSSGYSIGEHASR
jgi:hypothetical protein